jgi:hypothetical protein
MLKLRGLFMALGTVAMSTTAITLAIAPAQASGFSPINVWNTGHCLDNATENNSRLQMWRCTGGPEQNWNVSFDATGDAFTFVNQNTGWCLTAPTTFGRRTAFMEPCGSAANPDAEHWNVYFADNPLGPPSGVYDVWQNAATGLCLSTDSVGDGNIPSMNNCDPSDQYDRWHQQ